MNLSAPKVHQSFPLVMQTIRTMSVKSIPGGREIGAPLHMVRNHFPVQSTLISELGDLKSRMKPEIVKGAVGKGVTGLACGWAHSVFLMESGEVWTSGNRVGTGLPVDTCTLMQVL
uniref:Uncharacterized protein n=1 Tax=Spongospora subterranea TaxID=70186 RepID=A0A0H5QKP7_9EUKA|eukprot:CRZ02202.1 hypothetical protein [Spongospora subterranea]